MQIRMFSPKSRRPTPCCSEPTGRGGGTAVVAGTTIFPSFGWVGLAGVVVVIAFHRLWSVSSPSTNNMPVDNSETARIVRFEEIPADVKSGDSVLRYAAFLNTNYESTVSSDSETSSSSPLSMGDWILLMKENKGVIATVMTELLQKAPFDAFRFETPGVSVETVRDKPFEFVLVQDSSLQMFAAQEDPYVFAEHLECVNNNNQSLSNADNGPAACTFKNVGGDAILVSPRNWKGSTSNSNYHGHLANFMRGASSQQILETWRIVASALEEQLLGESPQRARSKPLWFSTAGGGVAWLHFRLDSRPKYYHYRPYREF
jgi:hypothetical protein